MREILFRGKTIDGEWVYGYVAIHTIIGDETELKTVIVQKPDKIYQYHSWVVDPETVGQYTGLKDKNGKKIYEGDLVRCTDGEDEVHELNSDTGIGEVEWIDILGFWNISNIENALGDIKNIGYIEIIGNIYRGIG